MSRFISLSIATLAITMTLVLSGCCSRNSGSSGYGCAGCGWLDQIMQEQVACMQEKVWAKRAFHLRYGHCERIHADHFREGFVSGYRNVCDGKGGQVPTLPPEKYWGFNYRNQEGVAMQDAWFAGYESGADSARADGSGNYQGIQISRQVQQAIMEADALEDEHAGIQRNEIVEMAPIRQGTSQMAFPQTSIPQTNIPFVTDSGSILKSAPMTNMPRSVPVPGTAAGYGVDTPLPIQAVPVVPGPSR